MNFDLFLLFVLFLFGLLFLFLLGFFLSNESII